MSFSKCLSFEENLLNEVTARILVIPLVVGRSIETDPITHVIAVFS